MKNVSFMPVSYVNNYQQQNYQIRKYNAAGDSVSFKATKQKTVGVSSQMLEDLLKNVSPDLGDTIKRIMSDPKGRDIFMTTLVSLAAAVTELLLNIGDKSKLSSDIIEVSQTGVSQEKDNAKQSSEAAESQKAKKPETEVKAGKTPVKTGKKTVTINRKAASLKAQKKAKEEALKAKLQKFAAQGLTLKEIGKKLGKSESTVSLYFKKFGIERTNCSTTKKPQLSSEQTEYINRMGNYSVLTEKYKELITSKKDKETKEGLDGFEKILQYLLGRDNLPPRERQKYFDLIQGYADNLKEIGIIANNLHEGVTIPEFLNGLKSKCNAELLVKWAQYPAFTLEELDNVSTLLSSKQEAIHQLKKAGNFTFRKSLDNNARYRFNIEFLNDACVLEEMKTISALYEALNGNIYLHQDKGNNIQRSIDLQESIQEFLDNDKSIVSVYNLLKYIEPEKMNKYTLANLQSITDEDLLNVKSEFKDIIHEMDINHNPRIKELEYVLNNNELYKNLLSNNHAKLRFVSRFVLKNDINDNELEEMCKKATDSLEQALSKKFHYKNSLVFSYALKDKNGKLLGLAPSFFLPKCELGTKIKVTLNNSGQIHTIFDDAIRIQNNNAE